MCALYLERKGQESSVDEGTLSSSAKQVKNKTDREEHFDVGDLIRNDQEIAIVLTRQSKPSEILFEILPIPDDGIIFEKSSTAQSEEGKVVKKEGIRLVDKPSLLKYYEKASNSYIWKSAKNDTFYYIDQNLVGTISNISSINSEGIHSYYHHRYYYHYYYNH